MSTFVWTDEGMPCSLGEHFFGSIAPASLSVARTLRQPSMSFRSSILRVAAAGIGLIVLVGGSAGSASPQVPDASTGVDTSVAVAPGVQKLVVRGMTEAFLGDYEEAIANFETALDQTPGEPALLQALADAYAARGEYTTALFYARRASKRGSGRPYHYQRLAEIQREAGRPEAALRTYRSLIDRFPDNTDAYRALAQLQSSLDRPEAALDTYDALLNHQSHPSVEVHRERLRLYRRVGNSRGVQATLETLVDLRPNNRSYRRLLGQIYAENGDAEAAVDLLASLLDATPNDTTLRRRVRQLYRKTGQTEAASTLTRQADVRGSRQMSVEALVDRAEAAYADATAASPPDTSLLNTAETLLQRALQQSSEHVEALTLRARIHEIRGNHRQVGQVLERVLEDHPRSPDRWVRAAVAYRKAGQYEQAASLAEEGFLLFPGHSRLARTAAFARLRRHEPEQALTHFRAALELQADDSTGTSDYALLKAGQGLAYTQLDRPQEAGDAFSEALSRAPSHPMVLSHYAYSLALRNSELDRALEMAQQAVEQVPTNPSALETLGWVQFRQGNLRAARTHLQKALDTGPASARLLEQYGDVQHALGNEEAAREYWQKALDRTPDRQSLRKKIGVDPNT